MTSLPNKQRLHLLEQLVMRSVPWLLRQQLPTGEFVTYREIDGQATPYVCPLLSALALDALDCLDSSSAHFHERLFDLIPAANRVHFRTTISTLRWRLRLHLAASQSSTGEWRRYGRDGDSPADLATTAFSYIIYLDKTLRPQRDYTGITSRHSIAQPDDILGQIFARRVLHLAAQCDSTMPSKHFSQIMRTPDPMLTLWAVAQACRQRALDCDAGQHTAMLELALRHLGPDGTFGSRLRNAFGITILSTCSDGSALVASTIDRCIESLLLDAEPPWLWPLEVVTHNASSAPVTLSIILRSLAQELLNPQQTENVSC